MAYQSQLFSELSIGDEFAIVNSGVAQFNYRNRLYKVSSTQYAVVYTEETETRLTFNRGSLSLATPAGSLEVMKIQRTVA